jgi:hypothetical protein
MVGKPETIRLLVKYPHYTNNRVVDTSVPFPNFNRRPIVARQGVRLNGGGDTLSLLWSTDSPALKQRS